MPKVLIAKKFNLSELNCHHKILQEFYKTDEIYHFTPMFGGIFVMHSKNIDHEIDYYKLTHLRECIYIVDHLASKLAKINLLGYDYTQGQGFDNFLEINGTELSLTGHSSELD